MTVNSNPIINLGFNSCYSEIATIMLRNSSLRLDIKWSQNVDDVIYKYERGDTAEVTTRSENVNFTSVQ